MKRIFGKSKDKPQGPPPPSLQETSEKLDESIASLDKKIETCDAELAKYRTQMGKVKGGAATSVKQRAMAVLKRKKMYEQQRDSILGTQFNIDQTQFTSEQMKTTAVAVSSLKSAATSLKQDFNKFNFCEIEKLQDDMSDLMYEHEEISELMGRSFNTGVLLDDADLEAEFEALGEELLNLPETETQVSALTASSPAKATPDAQLIAEGGYNDTRSTNGRPGGDGGGGEGRGGSGGGQRVAVPLSSEASGLSAWDIPSVPKDPIGNSNRTANIG